jgi:ribosome-binding factor A
MASRRSSRVAGQIKEEISDIIRNEMKDPRISFLTITSVDLSSDLRYARVYFSVLGERGEQSRNLKSLEQAAGFIRSQLGRRIRIRHIPELHFFYDDSFDHAQRIAEVMKKLEYAAPSSADQSSDTSVSEEDEAGR